MLSQTSYSPQNASSSSLVTLDSPSMRARQSSFPPIDYDDLDTPAAETPDDAPLLSQYPDYLRLSPNTSKVMARRRLYIIIAVLLISLASIAAGMYVTDSKTFEWQNPLADVLPAKSSPESCKFENKGSFAYSSFNRTANAQGTFIAPKRTNRFRDALLPNQYYVTSLLTAGWTNDVMAVFHTLHIAQLTRRIAVLPPFQPSHISYLGKPVGFIDFSDIFDIPSLSAAIGVPIIEWRDIKDLDTTGSPYVPEHYQIYHGGEREELGCWSLWMTQKPAGGGPRPGPYQEALNLSISWTPVPFGYTVPFNSSEEYNTHMAAALSWPGTRSWGIERANTTFFQNATTHLENEGFNDTALYYVPDRKLPIPNYLGHQIHPDEQMLCFDYTYFMAVSSENEWWQEWWPAWHLIGRHLRWSESVLQKANAMLAQTLHPISATDNSAPTPGTTELERSVGAEMDIPKYIAVHIRRGDMSVWCGFNMTRIQCLAPLDAYHKRVEQVRAALPLSDEERKAVKVIVMSDEPEVTPPENPGYQPGECEAWWNRVRNELGWLTVDHVAHKTADIYGTWYPAIMDAAMLSLASGFVGTEKSTYSMLAMRRVREWTEGRAVATLVKWGWPGADEGVMPPPVPKKKKEKGN